MALIRATAAAALNGEATPIISVHGQRRGRHEHEGADDQRSPGRLDRRGPTRRRLTGTTAVASISTLASSSSSAATATTDIAGKCGPSPRGKRRRPRAARRDTRAVVTNHVNARRAVDPAPASARSSRCCAAPDGLDRRSRGRRSARARPADLTADEHAGALRAHAASEPLRTRPAGRLQNRHSGTSSARSL